MANVLYPPPRPLTVGEILDLAFRIFRATLVGCLLYAAVSVIASQLPNIYGLASGRSVVRLIDERDPLWWALNLVGSVAALILWGAIMLRQHAMVSSGAASAAGELASALHRTPSLLLWVILIALAIGVWFIPAVALRGATLATLVLVVLLLSIPATYVWVRLSCSLTVLLLTGKGAWASVVHSWRLVTGSWWRLTVIYTVGAVLLLVLYVLSGVVALVIAALLAHGDLAVITAVTTVVVVILSAVGTPFYTALALAVFGDLAVRREGADLAQRIAAGPE